MYQAAAVPKEEGKTASVPSMIQQVIEAFNQLNLVAGDILEHAQPVAHEVGVGVLVTVIDWWEILNHFDIMYMYSTVHATLVLIHVSDSAFCWD